jgi:hypothetical protein
MYEASKHLVLLTFMALQGPGKNDLSQYNELYVLCVYNLLQSHKRFAIQIVKSCCIWYNTMTGFLPNRRVRNHIYD